MVWSVKIVFGLRRDNKKVIFGIWRLYMKTITKYLVLVAVFGFIYLDFEIIARAVRHDIKTINGMEIGYASLAGWTSLWMFFIGGIIGTSLGLLDERHSGYRQPWYFIRACLGVVIIYAVEFCSGIIFNHVLELHLWHYTDLLNICHQITLLYLPVWFVMSVFAQWLDDVIRYGFDRSRPWPGNFYQAMAAVFRF